MKKNALWLKFILIGTELAFMILAGLFIGDKADKYFDSSPTFIIIGVVAGSIGGKSKGGKSDGKDKGKKGKEGAA